MTLFVMFQTFLQMHRSKHSSLSYGEKDHLLGSEMLSKSGLPVTANGFHLDFVDEQHAKI